MRSYPIGNGTLAPRVPHFFAALMEALQTKGANVDGLACLKYAEWEKLLKFSDLAHLTLPLAEVATAEFPAWVLERLAKNTRDNRDRFERIYATYREARVALEHAGIPHVVLKGFTQAPEFVSDPRLRMQSDIDLFCPPEHTRDAEAVLTSLGYRPVGCQDFRAADHIPTLVRPGSWTWQGNMYDPAMPNSIEIHFCLWNDKVSLVPVPEVELFWQRRVMVNNGDLNWVALSPPDKVAYLALHILRDILSGDWVVHHVRELACFLQAYARDAEFWREWHNLHSTHLRRLQMFAFSLAQSWFSCPMPEAAVSSLSALPPIQEHWLEHHGGSPLEAMFGLNKDGRLLHWLLANSPEARNFVLRRTLLPRSIPGPRTSAKRTPNRRQQRGGRGLMLLCNYAKYLSERTWAHLSANAKLICHGTSAWFSTRSLPGN